MSQTAVSIEGTLTYTLFPFKSFAATGLSPLSITTKSGATSPTLTVLPSNVT